MLRIYPDLAENTQDRLTAELSVDLVEGVEEATVEAEEIGISTPSVPHRNPVAC